MRETENKIATIILAAGKSSRLGQPKQLLNFKGQTLIRRAVETAIQSDTSKVFVVLGFEFEKIKAEIEDLKCAINFNEYWKDGMSSSIKTGLEKLLESSPEISAVIISLCDQPLIKSSHLNLLSEKFRRTKKPVVSAFYKNKFGVPALFAQEKFSELLTLEGDQGARKILNKNFEITEKIEMPEAAFDIDTIQDYEKLKSEIFN